MCKGRLVAVGFAGLAVAAAGWWLAGYGMFGRYGMMGYGRPGAGWVWPLGATLGWLGMAAFWAAVLIGATLAVRALVAPGPGQTLTGPEDPLEVARRRYAAGEIDRQTFEQLRRDLQH